MNKKTSYPLSWPAGYPRAKFRSESRFKKPTSASRPGIDNSRRHSIDEARRFLADEIIRLGGTDAIISSNLILRADGNPHGQQAQPFDPGVCAYFTLAGKQVALPCDKWQHVQCNIYAIGKHIESMRGQDRWGVGSIERAFVGYHLALEQQTQAKWFEVLECPENASEEQIKTAWRSKLNLHHPDRQTGNPVEYQKIQEAYRLAMQLRATK